MSRADIVELIDGTVQEGTVLHEDEHTITLQIQMGAIKGRVVIKRLDIKSMRVSDTIPDPAIAEGAALERAAEQLTDVKKATEAWLKVADFYSRHAGFSSMAHDAYSKVLLLDADNEIARDRLGFAKTATGWAAKVDLQRAAAAREQEKVQAVVAVKPVDDETVIGLRADDAKLKKIIDEKNARAQAELPGAPPAPPVQPGLGMAGAQPQQFGADQLPYPPPGTAVNTVIEQYNGLPYTPTILYGFGPGIDGYYGGYYGNGFYGGGYGGYSGYGGSGFYGSRSYSNSGLSLGFRGHIGSVQFSGGTNGGGFGNFGGGHHHR